MYEKRNIGIIEAKHMTHCNTEHTKLDKGCNIIFN